MTPHTTDPATTQTNNFSWIAWALIPRRDRSRAHPIPPFSIPEAICTIGVTTGTFNHFQFRLRRQISVLVHRHSSTFACRPSTSFRQTSDRTNQCPDRRPGRDLWGKVWREETCAPTACRGIDEPGLKEREKNQTWARSALAAKHVVRETRTRATVLRILHFANCALMAYFLLAVCFSIIASRNRAWLWYLVMAALSWATNNTRLDSF